MTTYTSLTKCIPHILNGQAGIIPTDTIYGAVAGALDPAAVQKVYDLKGCNPEKPCIILVGAPDKISQFGVPTKQIQQVAAYWPAPLSVIFEGISDEFAYLHRGTHSLSFRVPGNEPLRTFLASAGPLIAPSANPEGHTPASSIQEAHGMFGDAADFYVDGGTLHGEPSTVIRLHPDGALEVLRPGAFALPAPR